MAQDIPQLTIDRLPAVRAKCGLSRSAVYQAIARGAWPRPIRLGPRSVGWPASETTAILRARVAGRSDEEIRELVRRLEAARRHADGAAA